MSSPEGRFWRAGRYPLSRSERLNSTRVLYCRTLSGTSSNLFTRWRWNETTWRSEGGLRVSVCVCVRVIGYRFLVLWVVPAVCIYRWKPCLAPLSWLSHARNPSQNPLFPVDQINPTSSPPLLVDVSPPTPTHTSEESLPRGRGGWLVEQEESSCWKLQVLRRHCRG